MSALKPRRLVLAVVMVSLAACSKGTTNLGQGSACTSSNECADGMVCDSGQCRAACNFASDCPSDTQCTNGLCVPLPHGVCKRDADCVTPPGTCHVLEGATCVSGTCNYPRNADGACGEVCSTAATCVNPGACQVQPATCVDSECIYPAGPDSRPCDLGGAAGVCLQGRCVGCASSSDCDPLTHGLDRCSTGTCSSNTCVFTPVPDCPYVPLATACAQDTDCRSGHCADGICCDAACDGVCEQCTAGTGRCDTKPADDAACGFIVCNGLTSTCRQYSNLNNATGHRCAAFGRCAQNDSPSDCVVYTNASDTTVCRPAATPCDIEEQCTSGACPDDAFVGYGGHCPNTVGDDDIGVCDASENCEQLQTFASADRYYLEEASLSDNRADALGSLALTATYTDDVFAITDTTGQGLSWGSTTATSTYCGLAGSSVLPGMRQSATLEVDFMASLGTYSDELIAGFTTGNVNTFGLTISHDAADPAQATLTAYYSGNALTYTIDPRVERLVAHLVFDSNQASPTARLRLFINGTAVSGSGLPPAMNSKIDFSTSSLCVGNATVATDSALTGTVWYAAVYAGTPSATQIADAAARLTISDAP